MNCQHRGEPVTLLLNVLGNVIFSGSIVVFSLTIIIIVQKQPLQSGVELPTSPLVHTLVKIRAD